MKKIRLLVLGMFLLILILALVVPGCSSSSAPTTSQAGGAAKAPAAKQIVIRYSGANPPDHQSSKTQVAFADEVAKRTNGAIKIEVYQSGELYQHTEVVDAVINGAVEMAYCSGGHWGGRTPLFGFYNYTGLLDNMDHYARALDQLNALLSPYFEKQGVKLVHWLGYGTNVYGGKKKVVLPTDFKGLMVRGQNSASNAFLKALGAATASMASNEVYDAMSKGAIDGSISSWSTIRTEKWTDVAPYYTAPITTPVFLTFMNLKTFNSLSADNQKIILEAGKAAQKMSWDLSAADDQAGIADAKAKKGDVTILNAEQTKAWQQAGRATWSLYQAECDKAGCGDTAKEVIKVIDATR